MTANLLRLARWLVRRLLGQSEYRHPYGSPSVWKMQLDRQERTREKVYGTWLAHVRLNQWKRVFE